MVVYMLVFPLRGHLDNLLYDRKGREEKRREQKAREGKGRMKGSEGEGKGGREREGKGKKGREGKRKCIYVSDMYI